jgi:hypothetical protein
MAAQEALPGMHALAVRNPSIEEIIMTAIERNAPVESIERLVNLRQQIDAKRAEEEFNEAMSAIQMELRPVQTDLENPQTRSKYASYHALDKKIRPIYTKHGFSLSFGTTDCPIQDYIRVLCYVSRSGHTRTYQCDMPADGKGAKGGDVMTKTHATGSAMSYGMRYLLKMIFNIAVGEDDNDGNGADGALDISEELEFLANSKDLPELQRLYTLYYKRAFAAKDKQAMQAIMSAKNRRKAELS